MTTMNAAHRSVLLAMALASSATADAQTRYMMREYIARLPTDGSTAPKGLVATSIELRSAINTCVQVAELEVYADGVNVAAAANGGSASSNGDYSGTSNASKAIDGAKPADYPQIFHGVCGGDLLTVSFAHPSAVTGVVAWGRRDCCGERDLFAYVLKNGSATVASGTLDARDNKVGSSTPS
jgi:hypothetical protein